MTRVLGTRGLTLAFNGCASQLQWAWRMTVRRRTAEAENRQTSPVLSARTRLYTLHTCRSRPR